MLGRRGCGHGEDSLPPEFCHAGAKEFARMLWPLWAKALCRLEHPLAWKGGMM